MNYDIVRDKRILVTGGTGFVGSRVVPMLLRAGAKVTLLCRKSSHTENYPSSVRVLRTDLCKSQDFLPALCECDIFIHMAALLFGLGWQDYLKANCGAAQNLASMLRAAGDRGPKRVILVSSLAAAGPCDQNEGRSENQPCEPVSAYGWSKVLTENIFRGAAQDRLVILRPPIIYGSGDLGLLPVYRGLAKGIGAVPGVGRRFPVSILHVDDMAQAVFLACMDEAHGIYHLSDGDVWSMAEFYAAAAKALECKAHIFHLPLWLMGMTALASTGFAQLVRIILATNNRAPNWNLDKYREASQCGWVASNRRIVEELGFRPTQNLESGMAETIAGYKSFNLL